MIAGPRNHLYARYLLGTEEAVDPCAARNPDDPIARLARGCRVVVRGGQGAGRSLTEAKVG